MSNNQSLQQVINREDIRKRFEDMLGSNAASFLSSILTLVNSNNKLKECSTASILSAAGIAAALNLPISPSLSFAYIVPYKVGNNYQAQFQISSKGLTQLAMRSGQYRKLHAGPVLEGQVKDIDFITGDLIRGEKVSDKVVGYVGYLELLNGFSKTLYMTKEEIAAHAKRYSQSYAYDLKNNRKTSVWSTNFDAMAKKTVLKLLLAKYGVMSIDMRSTDMAVALSADQAVIKDDGSYRYIDNEHPKYEGNIVNFSDVIGIESADDIDNDISPSEMDEIETIETTNTPNN